MLRFFISHSSRMDDRTKAVLAGVRQRLEDDGHIVFVDDVIEPGERWRPRLLYELGRCDVGIVLLDEAAMDEHAWWVRREVYYLLWRHYLGSVQVRAVLFDGVSSAAVRDGGYAELVETQLTYARGKACDEVVECVLAGFGAADTSIDDRMSEWLDEIHDSIRHIKNWNTLDRFAAKLGISAGDLTGVGESERHRFVAHQLIGRPKPVHMLRAFETVEAALGAEHLRTLTRNAAPALIDGESAWQLLRWDPTDPDRVSPVFVLNAERSSTSDLYVRRAVCNDSRVGHAAVSSSVTGIDVVADLHRRCELALMDRLNIRGRDHEGKRRRLAEYVDRPLEERTSESVYLAIEAAHGQMAAVVEVCRRLRRAYPWLAVIVLTGPGQPPDPTEWQLDEVIVLSPGLGPGEEDRVDEIYWALDKIGRGVSVD